MQRCMFIGRISIYLCVNCWFDVVSAIMKSAGPPDATLFSNRSLCLIKMGEGEKALFDAEACWGMQPYWPKAYYRKGAAHMLLKVS